MAPGICTDVDAAAACSAAGVDVVLVLPEGAWFDAGRAGVEPSAGGAPVGRGAGGAGPGRVAIFVVGRGEEPDRAVVAAMGAELFGPSGP